MPRAPEGITGRNRAPLLLAGGGLLLALLLLALLLLIFKSVRPPRYYLDSQGGSDLNPGDAAERPWRTLAPLHAQRLPPGAVVFFKRGSRWSGGLVIDDSGQPDRPIVFTAYGRACTEPGECGERPEFTHPGDAEHRTRAILVEADWVIVEGLRVRDAHEAGVYLAPGADHNVVRDIEATDVGTGIIIAGQFNLVTRNYLHDLHMVVNTPGGDDDFGAVGLKLYGSHNEISYNRMVNCLAPSYDYGQDGGGVEFYGQTDGNQVHHNWVSDSAGFLEVGGGAARDTLVAYNISLDNGRFSYLHLAGPFASVVTDFRVENNTIVEVASEERGWVLLDFRGDPSGDTLVARNNIFYADNFSYIADESGFRHDHNLYYLGRGTELGLALGAAEQTANPQFANLAGGDLHLLPGSPAIDAGLDLGYTLDFDRGPVPVGPAPDLGAFELGVFQIGWEMVTTQPCPAWMVHPGQKRLKPPALWPLNRRMYHPAGAAG